MRATITVEVPVPGAIVARLQAQHPEELSVHQFFDDPEASAAMAKGAGAAKARLDAAAKKIDLANSERDIQYGVSGVGGWTFWYQRTFS